MKKINIRRVIYKIRHKYWTMNNAVILIALMISAGWVWGSLTMMQRNYRLQRDLDEKSRQLIVAQLAVENSKLEQKYYKTMEYQELAARQRLGLVLPGESVLVLSSNLSESIDDDTKTIYETGVTQEKTSNFVQWINFLFGNNNSRTSR